MTRFYAHTLEGRPREEWQELLEHLEGVAWRAAEASAVFGSADWGRLAGLWHDLGKYRPLFQAYLRGEVASAEHSVVGALWARERGRGPGGSTPDPARFWAGEILALVIAGHHGGLPDREASDEERRPPPLEPRLREKEALLEEARPFPPRELLDHPLPNLPERLLRAPRDEKEHGEIFRSFEFWIRFLFSALVDADFLDTELFMEPERGALRQRDQPPLEKLRYRLDAHVDSLTAGALASEVNAVRAEVLAACRARAEDEPGFFSLTVPTGGGKTLASTSFALRHACRHGLRRVIAVVPFTSIIEQNAAVLSEALGEENVLEHHSNLDTQDWDEERQDRHKLASENWDVPVIVTTAVQFFESLFANRTSRCRKLHNVAGSVIVLDEAQTLPPELLQPILEGLRELVAHYGATVVLSTATQPALEKREAFSAGIEGSREIVKDPRDLARRLERFRVDWSRAKEPVEWEELAAELEKEEQALAIVHRRDDARILAELIEPESRFHLSALMCGAHRKTVLAQVASRLADKAPCRLISTQLIEAGVDIDFPVVYRAFGGLDSLVQAGGRCNREGRADLGRLVIFRASSKPPPGSPQRGLEAADSLLRHHGEALELTDPEQIREYFRTFLSTAQTDAKAIREARAELRFATVARRFRLIDEWSAPVLVPWGDARERLDRYRDNPRRQTLRDLQPYLVNVRPWHLERLREAGAVELVHDTVYAFGPGYEELYDEELGLRVEGEMFADPERLYFGGR